MKSPVVVSPPPPEPELVTVTVHDPDFVVSTVDLAVIVVEPTATAVTVPLLTVAILVSSDNHSTVCAGLLVPLTVAVKLPDVVPFKSRLKLDGETLTDVTVGVGVGVSPPLIELATVIVVEPVALLPSFAVAVIVALPVVLVVTTPYLLTVATLVLLLDQVTVCKVVFDGVKLVTKETSSPGVNVKLDGKTEMLVAFVTERST